MNLRSRFQAFTDSLCIRRVRGTRTMPDGVILLCRVENGMEWIPQFLTHYRRLGVAHMIFLDTGSTDGSVDHLQGSDVTVYRTSLPFKTHRLWMRRWLMDRCPPGTWTLNVDIDELFVFPHINAFPPPLTPPPPSTGSGQAPGEGDLPSLVAYLDQHHFTAMRAHMLDLFASGPIGSREAPADAPLEEQYPFYDISDVHPITDSWMFPDESAWMGGIRKMFFSSNDPWSQFCLTKHPLIQTGRNVRAFEINEHGILGASVADITGALLHFKFTQRFRMYVDEAVRRGQHWNASAEYQLYQSVLREHPNLSLKRPTARRWTDVQALVDAGFLQAAGSSTMEGSSVPGKEE